MECKDVQEGDIRENEPLSGRGFRAEPGDPLPEEWFPVVWERG